MKKILCFICVAAAAICCKPTEEAPLTDGLKAPVAGTDMFVEVNEMTASFSYTGEEVAKYRWKLSTGETLDSRTASFTFDEPGNYSVSLGIANKYDYVWSDSYKFTIEAPVIPLTKPVLGLDMTISIEGRVLSLGYTGDVATSVLWEISDGTSYSKRNITHTFAADGEYNVRLGVSDGGEFIYSDRDTVTAIKIITLKAGTKLFIAGEGVAAIDEGHTMTYLPNMDYHPSRSVSAHFSDNCSYKNDAGTPQKEYFNAWTGYDKDSDTWTSYFDYEIFAQLIGGKDIYFCDKDKTIYIAQTGDYTWKDQPSAGQGHIGGKTMVQFSDTPIAFQVPQDGIYRIRFNSTNKECYVSTFTQLTFRTWPGPVNIAVWNSDTPGYLGKGVFEASVNFKSQTDGGQVKYDGSGKMGYKFLFMGFDSDQPTGMQYIGQAFKAWDGKDVKYWSLVPVQGGPWSAAAANSNGTFECQESMKDQTLKLKLFFNDTYGAYVHFFEE